MKPKKSEPKKLYSWSTLDREHAAKRMREYVGRSPRLLEDHVNFGLACMDVLYRDYIWQRSSNTTVAILCAFRRSLEFLDAVDVLLAAAVAAAPWSLSALPFS